ncbi:MAG: hypothetical protein K2K45_06955 [Muribaculaceae bacterium]|nr:hypothetical protein [Muribaculaceae bacterium]
MGKQFEYHSVHIPNDTEYPNVKLDVFGRKGWEAYGVAPYDGGVIYFLKREVDHEPCN